MITILKAPAYLTVQDRGRPAARSLGVPIGGAMDLAALATANALVGNASDAAALEWSLTGGTLRFERDSIFALSGADADATLDGDVVVSNTTRAARAGSVLDVPRIVRGRFLYLAVAGGVDVPPVLGARSTYLPGRFGGLEGRLIKTGDAVPVGAAASTPPISAAHAPRRVTDGEPIRFVRGPDAAVLPSAEWDRFSRATFTLAHESDRTGYRMRSPDFAAAAAAGGRSSPSCTGAIQLTPDGEVIVLMADAPTISGYAKIGAVITADIGRLGQRTPGTEIRFAEVTLAEARAAIVNYHIVGTAGGNP